MKLNEDEVFDAELYDKGSIKVLDAFFESKKRYLYDTSGIGIFTDEKIYNVCFVLSNQIPIGKQIIPTNITLTELKKLYSYGFLNPEDVLDYRKRLSPSNRCAVPKLSVPVLDFLEMFYDSYKENFNDSVEEDELILFDNPISINAQSSKNRSGYGSMYSRNILVHEGTKYGETSQLPIIGYAVSYYGYWKGNDIIHLDKKNDCVNCWKFDLRY